jgi:hypothetical protein
MVNWLRDWASPDVSRLMFDSGASFSSFVNLCDIITPLWKPWRLNSTHLGKEWHALNIKVGVCKPRLASWNPFVPFAVTNHKEKEPEATVVQGRRGEWILWNRMQCNSSHSLCAESNFPLNEATLSLMDQWKSKKCQSGHRFLRSELKLESEAALYNK